MDEVESFICITNNEESLNHEDESFDEESSEDKNIVNISFYNNLIEPIIYNYDTVIHTDLGHGFDHSNK